ncbi:MAG: glutaredoxin domain-containing protein [Candidatus Cloacimonetes bacterium]|jgi:glutaredoxin 3|nr:glutaredoxin domain-containing protein [Candidatus Cloacimonadota bacterium]
MKTVVVFSTPTCSWCKKLKSYLKDNSIRFKDVDVSRDQRAARDMIRKSGKQGVPQMWINNSAIVGFDKAKIDRMLAIK